MAAVGVLTTGGLGQWVYLAVIDALILARITTSRCDQEYALLVPITSMTKTATLCRSEL